VVATTGQVLHTAARHIQQFTWVKMSFGNHSTGLCLHGAIYSALIELNGYAYDERDDNDFDILDIPMSETQYMEVNAQSYQAVDILAKLLPDTCSCGHSFSSVNSFVYHYNDVHCTGGEEAALLLEQASEKWEANQ
jgi:hypothetical protein